MSIVDFYSLSNVCQYPILYSLLVLCHYVHCCLLKSFQCLSVPHTVQYSGSVSPCPMLLYTVCPLSVNTSQCSIFWFYITVSTALFYSLSPVCQYLTLYRLLILFHCFHCCLLHSVHCLSVPHTALHVGSVPLCPFLPSTVFAMSVNALHSTVCLF